jgi:hypothetical protein
VEYRDELPSLWEWGYDLGQSSETGKTPTEPSQPSQPAQHLTNVRS